MKHPHWIAFSGLLWAVIGAMLLFRGLELLKLHTTPNATLLWTTAALLIGYMKGRFVFSRTVARITNRIRGLSLPISWKKVYPPVYWIVIGSMGFLGMIFRLLPPDWRGCADVAVGSALLYGALLYFRNAYELYTQET